MRPAGVNSTHDFETFLMAQFRQRGNFAAPITSPSDPPASRLRSLIRPLFYFPEQRHPFSYGRDRRIRVNVTEWKKKIANDSRTCCRLICFVYPALLASLVSRSFFLDEGESKHRRKRERERTKGRKNDGERQRRREVRPPWYSNPIPLS